MRIARLLGRLLIGGLFFAHGTQKLFGWFGGPGPEATARTMEKLEMHPGKRNALAAGSAETFGGLGIALGALTPAAAAALIGTMITAIRTVHLKKGFFNTGGGYEFNLSLIAALLSLLAGATGSTLAIAAGHKAAPHAPDHAPEPQPTPASN